MSRQGRPGCEHCDFLGYTKHAFWNGEKDEITVTPCSVCKDTRGYNLYIKQRYSKDSTLQVLEGGIQLADVIDFQKYKDGQEMRYYSKEESQEMGLRQFDMYGEIPKLKS